MSFSQVPHTILMVRPASFGFNPDTAGSNSFQKESTNPENVHAKALKEFDEVVLTLERHGINVMVVDDTMVPKTTDAIFPNNWITTHEDGKIILYPMMAPSRRLERRQDIVELLEEKFEVKEIINLSNNENENRFLEGTGSIIFDHPNRIAYACQSDRTDEQLFRHLCHQLGYTSVLFQAVNENGIPIYHTNVMMWIGEKVAGLCLDAIPDEDEQEMILNSLSKTAHKVIALSFEQMNSFAGNMFEVKGRDGKEFLLLSESAFNSLLPGQLLELEKHVTPLPLNISTIEESGGGSIRCMVAGIHLPAK
ncbi:MAG: arginine deiminase-related protein [Cyclobacteriaceae bacterium]